MKKTGIIVILILISIVFVSAQEVKTAYRHGLKMITPSTQWREALPSGNGTIGALVYGNIHQERILFNHNQLWNQGYVDEIPPSYDKTGLFLPDVIYKITVIKTNSNLYLNVEGENVEKLFSRDLKDGQSPKEGRIGLRHMFTRSAQYRDFKVFVK